MNTFPTWDALRERWPNAADSRFIDCAGLRWHVQMRGTGQTVVLLHGSGSATHSWRDVLPLLASQCTVCAPDLPGHGFTSHPSRDDMSIERMSDGLRELLHALELTPTALVGHSAGGALALSLATSWPNASIVGINAALAPPNAAMTLLTPAVQALAGTGLVGFLTARLAESDWVFDSLMRSTGSTISRDQMALYRIFAQSEEHATAVMSMFAEWRLPTLVERLPSISNRVTLIMGARDSWVPGADTARVAARMPNVELITVADAGHLAHEEQPERVSDIIIGTLRPPT